MLANASFNQAIDRVIYIVCTWLYSLVAEVDGVLDVSVILNMRDVTGGGIGVTQAFQTFRSLVASGEKRDKPERLFAVPLPCGHTIAILHPIPLTTRITTNT